MKNLFHQFTGWIATGWRRRWFGGLAVVLTFGLGLLAYRRWASPSNPSGGAQAGPVLSEGDGAAIKTSATEAADSTVEAIRRQAEKDKAAGRAKYGDPE